MTLEGELRRSNCLIFAIKKLYKSGGYLIIRKSRWTWVPHVMWAKSIEHLEVIEFKPTHPLLTKWGRRIPIQALVFRGRIREGMGEER